MVGAFTEWFLERALRATLQEVTNLAVFPALLLVGLPQALAFYTRRSVLVDTASSFALRTV